MLHERHEDEEETKREELQAVIESLRRENEVLAEDAKSVSREAAGEELRIEVDRLKEELETARRKSDASQGATDIIAKLASQRTNEKQELEKRIAELKRSAQGSSVVNLDGISTAECESQKSALTKKLEDEKKVLQDHIKQLEDDPFSDYVAEHDKGTIVTGILKSVDAKAAVVTLSEEVEGVLKASEISRDKVEDARNVLKPGDEIEVKIINIDRKNRSMNLSVKAKDLAEEKEAIKSLRKRDEKVAPATLGDLIKAQMENQEQK